MYANSHTRLLNKLIGLFADTVSWPRMLYDVGYRVQLIEQGISLNSRSIAPDVVGVSDAISHAIVADCKSGVNVEDDQDSRYNMLDAKSLLRWLTVSDGARFTHTICYVVNESNHGQLSKQTRRPFIVFGDDFVEGRGNFEHPALNNALAGRIQLGGMREPVSLYPFSLDDNAVLAQKFILAGVLSCMAKDPKKRRDFVRGQDMEQVMKTIHPFFKYMETRYRNSLVRKARKWFEELLMIDDDLRDLHNRLAEGGASTQTLQKFNDRCKKLLDNRRVQARITDNF